LDYNYEKLPELKKRYGADAEIEIAQPEGRFLLTCNRTDMTVWDWVREFGLETIDDYFARARKERAKVLAGTNADEDCGTTGQRTTGQQDLRITLPSSIPERACK
jgi:hypothetical protein